MSHLTSQLSDHHRGTSHPSNSILWLGSGLFFTKLQQGDSAVKDITSISFSARKAINILRWKFLAPIL